MKILFTAFFLFSTFCLQAQVFKKILDKTKEKTERKISEKISDKVSDAASKPIDDATSERSNKNSKKTDKRDDREDRDENSSNSTVKNSSEKKSLSTYSKYDFVPGEKILVYEDFSRDALGDFPAKWNTNGSAELVKVNGETGQWLKISKKGKVTPEFITNLPENFTMEFDVICNEDFSFYSPAFTIMLLSGGASNQVFDYSFIGYGKRSGVLLKVHPHNAGMAHTASPWTSASRPTS